MTVALVVTSIQAPNPIMQALARACMQTRSPFFVLGDRKSPPQYVLDGAEYFGLDAQHERFGAFSRLLPTGHYVRKNLGYLAALEAGVEWIVETDDDNDPLPNFMTPPTQMRARLLQNDGGWLNVYDHFGPSQSVWPRGFPLEALQPGSPVPVREGWVEERPLLVQGLADDNPDVDAVYRLTRPLPVRFDHGAAPVVLASDNWCPFNSQNTWWHRSIAVLAYLPAHCSFRMTDIWRSFVAQRCLWAMGQRVCFVAPTVRQARNEHNLLRDFEDEVPGYLQNEKIRKVLQACALQGKPEADLMACYRALADAAILSREELPLVEAWIEAVHARA
jgi:hypothetical protein